MKDKLLIAFLSLLWFFLLQGECEMVTKPEPQNDFPIIKGFGVVYCLGLVLLLIGAVIIFLGYQIKRSKS